MLQSKYAKLSCNRIYYRYKTVLVTLYVVNYLHFHNQFSHLCLCPFFCVQLFKKLLQWYVSLEYSCSQLVLFWDFRRLSKYNLLYHSLVKKFKSKNEKAVKSGGWSSNFQLNMALFFFFKSSPSSWNTKTEFAYLGQTATSGQNFSVYYLGH